MPGTGGGEIEDIDFRRGTGGEGLVLIKLSDPTTSVNVDQVGGKIVVDFANAKLPEKLDRRLDVVDFATPVKEIDTKPRGNGTHMVITPTGKGEFDHLAYQTDNLFTVELKPLTKEQEEAAKKAKFGYTGEKLSLNFQNIEVRAVLQLLADFTGLNMVASDTVTGNVTQRFVVAYPSVFAGRLAELQRVDLRYSNGFSVFWQQAETGDHMDKQG